MKQLNVLVNYRNVWLANLGDGLYNSSNTETVFDAKATDRHVGDGFETQFTTTIARKNILSLGIGYMIPGEYLKHAGKTTGFLYPYVTFTRVL
jgi:hypothetical protein